MSLTQHLLELRKRLFIAAIGVVLGGIAGWFLVDPAWSYLQNPIRVIAESRTTGAAILNFPSVTSAFDIRMQITLMIGILISSPIWLYEIFAFLVPGLTGKERRYVFGFFFSAVPLFLGGAAAGLFVMPNIVQLMAGFVPQASASVIDAKLYLEFVLKLVLATGIAFVLPAFLVLLNLVGVLRGATILKSWRWAIIAITLFTAIATPAADVVSMVLLAIPMVVLFFGAVGISLWHDRAVARRERATLDPGLAGA